VSTLLEKLHEDFRPVIYNGYDPAVYCLWAYTERGILFRDAGNDVPFGRDRIHIHMLGYVRTQALRLAMLRMHTTTSNVWELDKLYNFTRGAGGLEQLADKYLAITRNLANMFDDNNDGQRWSLEMRADRHGDLWERECPEHKVINSFRHLVLTNNDQSLLSDTN